VTRRVYTVDTDGNEVYDIKFPEETTTETAQLGYVPVMLRSLLCALSALSPDAMTQLKECPFDQGGYFIINGSEKVLIGQERAAANQVMTFQTSRGIMAEVRSMALSTTRPPGSMTVSLVPAPASLEGGGQVLRASLPHVNEPIPLAVLFRALGYASDREILERIVYDFNDTQMIDLVRPSLVEAASITVRQVALDYIGRRAAEPGASLAARVKFAEDLLVREFLPHIGQHEGRCVAKAFFLGYMVNKMLATALKRRDFDDRDHFGNKRIDLAGNLMGGLFRQLFAKVMKEVRTQVDAKLKAGRPVSVPHILSESHTISAGLKYCLATGNWTSNRGEPASKTGVSQVLSRLTFAAALSHLRRSNAPVGKEGKLTKPRQLHSTQWGLVCPAETPEGQACGIVKNMSLMSTVTVGTSADAIFSFLKDTTMDELHMVSPSAIPGATKVLVNGNWIGITVEAKDLVADIKALRRCGDLSWDISIVWSVEDREVRIYCDPGRMLRPLYIVEEGKLQLRKSHVVRVMQRQLRFDTLVQSGVVEYLDTLEEECSLIGMMVADVEKNATTHAYTHCEIHPAMVLGVCATIVPFPDHNQSPRNTYQSAMGKQAMGVYLTNFTARMDTLAHVFYYPQKPLVASDAIAYIHFKELPAGTMAVVAIGCYTGYNQEDSMILNQSAIDRGLYRSMYFRLHSDGESKKAGEEETFECPTSQTTAQMKPPEAYSMIDADGLVAPGKHLRGGDVVIGKTCPLPPSDLLLMAQGRRVMHTKRDASSAMKKTESGVCDAVMLSTDEDGNRLTKVRIRSIRIPQIGDKFASRHGQKGTCGMTYRQEDMPFTIEGITPDLIINPHAIPSRMTIGHLVECLLGKVAAISGSEGRATPFLDVTVQDVSAALHSLGYQEHGNEVLYNGFTGQRLEAPIFFGPTFYQRLKHLVDDKIHARARGIVQSLTRQPMEGRSKDGGLRFGEMERDCMISHGAANLMRDRLFLSSDKFSVHVCDLCGLVCVANVQKHEYVCTACKNSSAISRIDIPYASKLLFQELMSMCIVPRIFTKPHARAST
jgi:DNA-directed RNA polymerase II subunit RPB2